MWKFSLLTGVGFTSYFAGQFVERARKSESNIPVFSSLISSILAASPLNTDVVPVAKVDDLPGKDYSNATSFSRVGEVMKYGFPSLENVRSLDDYVLSYDRRNRVANWVFEHLTKETVRFNNDVDRAKCEFTEDESVHPFFRSKNSDYKGSGFDRGHLAAAGNHKANQRHCEQTFLLSNMAPQVGNGFNRHSWNRLEKYVRKLTKVYPNVHVCTGPLYLPKLENDGKMYVKYQVIGANSVAVPTHFYKVVVMEAADSSLHMEAYVMPNQVISDDTPLSVFQVPPESIERSAGLLFFDRLPRNKLKTINGKKSTWF